MAGEATSSCSGIDANCAADGWCPGDGRRHACFDAGKASTGLAGQATEAGACTARSESCSNGNTFIQFSFNGNTGCGANQYHDPSQCSQCCTACPAGRHKGPGCSKLGVEACCEPGWYTVEGGICCDPGTHYLAAPSSCRGTDPACAAPLLRRVGASPASLA